MLFDSTQSLQILEVAVGLELYSPSDNTRPTVYVVSKWFDDNTWPEILKLLPTLKPPKRVALATGKTYAFAKVSMLDSLVVSATVIIAQEPTAVTWRRTVTLEVV